MKKTRTFKTFTRTMKMGNWNIYVLDDLFKNKVNSDSEKYEVFEEIYASKIRIDDIDRFI